MDRRYRAFFAFAAAIFAIEIATAGARLIVFVTTGSERMAIDGVAESLRHYYAPFLACLVGAAFREQSRENRELRQALADRDDGRVNLT